MLISTLNRKIGLLRSLMDREVAGHGPLHVTIDVTRRCNLNCIGCRYHSRMIGNMQSPGNQDVQDIDPLLFSQLCHELARMGTRALELSGEGEPFVNRNLWDFIGIARSEGLTVTVFSNGTLLTKENIAALIRSGADCLRISLWGATKQVYKDNYPGTNPEHFSKVVDGLSRLAEEKEVRSIKKPYVILHHPINCNNYQALYDLVGLAHETGCEAISFSPLKTRRGELSSVSLEPDQQREVVSHLSGLESKVNALGLKHNIRDTLRRYELGEAVWRILPCYVGFLLTRVKVDGTIVPCNPCNIPMGNLNDAGIGQIWNNDSYRKFRRTTMTRQGLASMGTDCDCGFCCYLNDNWRVHRIFRWMSPLLS